MAAADEVVANKGMATNVRFNLKQQQQVAS